MADQPLKEKIAEFKEAFFLKEGREWHYHHQGELRYYVGVYGQMSGSPSDINCLLSI